MVPFRVLVHVPVVIFKRFEQVCLPFQKAAPLDLFAVVYEESQWLDDGVEVLLETLLALDQYEIELDLEKCSHNSSGSILSLKLHL